MRSFCVECGKEGVVYQGLCEECLPKKRRFIEVPRKLELGQCKNCGAYDLPSGLLHGSFKEAVDEVLRGAVIVPREVLRYDIDSAATPRDEHRFDVEVSARVGLEGMTIVEKSSLELFLKATTCSDCSKQAGEYYEGILQVRAEERSLTEAELLTARQIIEEKIRTSKGVFISKEEEIHGGLDVYMSSNEAARSIAKALRQRLGGTVSSSPKLHTRRQGKDLYRVTYLLRLPGLAEGDVVEIQGRPHLVLATGEPFQLLDLELGEGRTIQAQEMIDAKRMTVQILRGSIISQDETEVQVLDEEGFRVRNVTRPPGLSLEGEEVTLIVTERGDFLAPPRQEE